MVNNPPLRRSIIKISIGIACAAWCSLVAMALLRIPRNERTMSSLSMAVISWPVVHDICVGMCWGMAKHTTSIDESYVYGPAKELQLKLLRGPMLWWINAVVVLFPATMFVVTLLALIFGEHVFGS
jgi:hypothetical protein